MEAYAGDRTLLDEFMEVESGRKDNRPQLAAALALCRQKRALLVIAKLDRLARSVAFISNPMESGVEFVAVDMPQANRLTLHILAAAAEHEREMISQRTRAALAAAKARGVKLGNPKPNLAKAGAMASSVAARFRADVAPTIFALRAESRSLRRISAELNARGIRPAKGRQWHPTTIQAILSRDQS